MEGLQVFQSSEFGSVRVLVDEDGTILFSATEVAKALGYEKPHNAISRHCRWSLKRGVPHPQNPEKTIKMNFIPESDVYRLICSSKLESAQRFEEWVFEEVLPSIRKHGAYMTPDMLEKALSDPDLLIQMLITLKQERLKSKQLVNKNDQLTAENERLKVQQELDAPKVQFADAISGTGTTISVGDLAKVLCQNGVPDVGQNRLFAWLRKHGYIMRSGGYNVPTQKSMDAKLFRLKEGVFDLPGNQGQRAYKMAVVTPYGQRYFVDMFLNGDVDIND